MRGALHFGSFQGMTRQALVHCYWELAILEISTKDIICLLYRVVEKESPHVAVQSRLDLAILRRRMGG